MKEKKMDKWKQWFRSLESKKKRLTPLKDSSLPPPPPMLLMYTIIQEKLQNILNFFSQCNHNPDDIDKINYP